MANGLGTDRHSRQPNRHYRQLPRQLLAVIGILGIPGILGKIGILSELPSTTHKKYGGKREDHSLRNRQKLKGIQQSVPELLSSSSLPLTELPEVPGGLLKQSQGRMTPIMCQLTVHLHLGMFFSQHHSTLTRPPH